MKLLCVVGLHRKKDLPKRCAKICVRCKKLFDDGKWHRLSPWVGSAVLVGGVKTQGQKSECKDCHTIFLRSI